MAHGRTTKDPPPVEVSGRGPVCAPPLVGHVKGVAVIFVGEDLDVLLELCDRILVLCGGEVSGIVDGRTATKEEVGLLMTRVGGKEAAE